MDQQKKTISKTTTPERRVTQLRGDTVRPLVLTEEVKNHDILLPHKPPRALYKRPLPVNPNQLSFEPTPPVEQPAKRIKAPERDAGRVAYHKFMTLSQAGPATIASDSTKACSLVAIKRSQVKSKDSIPPIKGLPVANIVGLLDIFREDTEIFMVYEQMDVSLRKVNGITQMCWNSHEIAGICKEVLNGLSFIHTELRYYYGQLDCGSVLLNRDGQIKLGKLSYYDTGIRSSDKANIGECILEERCLTDSMETEDTRSIGFMMMELMEMATSLGDPRSTRLKYPEHWKDTTGIKEFLAATQIISREELCKVRFLPRESRAAYYLRPHVFMALVAAKTDWEIIAAPSPVN